MNYKYIIALITVISTISCSRKYIPKNGDLLFQDLDCGELCTAIEKVTKGIDGTNLSHVGIVTIENDSTFVYEAISKGISKTDLENFLNRSKDKSGKPKVIVGRIKNEYQYTIPAAINVCKSLMGKPYDNAFDIRNQSYYCSELVYFAFRDKNGNALFTLNPMTFKDPDTGETFRSWNKYFKTLQIPVPEGKPGTNPGGISKSQHINITFKFY